MNMWVLLSAMVVFCVWRVVDWREVWDGEARIVAAMFFMFAAFVIGFTDVGDYLLKWVLS